MKREIIGYPGRHLEMDEWQSALAKALAEILERWKRCPDCGERKDAWDTVAVHLIAVHGWDAERARLFLRDQVEEEAFHDPE